MHFYGNRKPLQPEYPKSVTLNIEERGLPVGKNWTLTIRSIELTPSYEVHYSEFTSQNSTIHLNVTNLNMSLSASSGQFYGSTVSPYFIKKSMSHESNLTVTFFRLYMVNFTETGLPENFTWQVMTDQNFEGPNANLTPPYDGYLMNSTDSNFTTLIMPNGTYGFDSPSYAISSVTYFPQYRTLVDLSGEAKLVVSGQNQTVKLNFTTKLYKLTVNEYGLPSGVRCYFNVSQTSSWRTYNSQDAYSLSAYLPAGDYEYQSGVYIGYDSTNNMGTYELNGSQQVLNINYSWDHVIRV